MRNMQWLVLVLIGTALATSSCRQDHVAAKHEPVQLEESGQDGIMRVILEPRAAERIGLETAAVREEVVTLRGRTVTRRVVPYGALMYDKHGDTWTFTSPAPLTFVRQHVVVEDIEGDRAILAEGPAAGTTVVTVGAAELMGAEHRYGAH